MPKRWMMEDEWHPVRHLAAYPNDFYPAMEAVDFTDEEIADLNRITAEFTTWQEKIAERFGFGPPRPGEFDLDDSWGGGGSSDA